MKTSTYYTPAQIAAAISYLSTATQADHVRWLRAHPVTEADAIAFLNETSEAPDEGTEACQ